jgi:hypothetical protein
MNRQRWVTLGLAAAALLAATGCERTQVVSYQKDVVPILDGFELGTYETLMKGTQFGPVVLPGDPLTSVLVMLIEGRVDPSLRMPHGDATTPTQDEILTIRRWVEQGAKNN